MERPATIWMVEYLLNSAWQTPLLFLCALLAARFLARLHSASVLHRMWVAALVLATALPACWINARPGIAWWHAATAAGGRVQVTVLPGAAVTAGNLRLSPVTMAVLLTLYVAVTLYFAGRIAWSLRKTEILRRNASASVLSESLRSRWEALSARFGVAHAALCVSPALSGPAVVGLHAVLLPSEFIGKVQMGDLDAALAHELAHLRRSDFVKNVVYAVLMLPVAFHPCAWLLRRRVEESREMVCDAMAAEALDGKTRYARSLLRLALAVPHELRGGAATAVGIFEGNSLERRVKIMMDRRKQLRGVKRVAAISAVLLLTAGVVAGMAGTHLAVQAADNGAAAGATAQAHIGLRVSAGVLHGMLVKTVIPKYPEEAKARHNTLDGVVTLGLTVNTQGEPTDIHVVKSLRKDYDQSAIVAVRQWRWKPYLLNGKPVPVESKVNIKYSLKI